MYKNKNVIDDYISGFPDDVQAKLNEIRGIIRKAVPEAEETINYAIPTFVLKGNLVHFAGFKNHVGFYPAPRGIEAFKDELSPYKGGRGTVQFPLDKPLPAELITKIVKFRVQENLEKADKKKTLKTCKNGHKYYKSSDCPTCPICEEARKPQDSFLTLLSAPARRALENEGLITLEKISQWSEKEILSLHGIGKSSIPVLQKELENVGLKFRE